MAVLTYSQTLSERELSQHMAILALGSFKSPKPSLEPGF
jgi:hypothetical protein